MNMKLVCFVVGFAVAALAIPAIAGVNANAKVAVHVMLHAPRTCIKNFPSIVSCHDIVYEIGNQDVDAFPVFFDSTFPIRFCQTLS